MPPAAPEQVDDLTQTIAVLRARLESDTRASYERGRDELIVELVALVDDCDRALDYLSSRAAADQWRIGVEQMRDRVEQRFAAFGYHSFRPVGESFDPTEHEAVAVEPDLGPDGVVMKVYRRGWRRDGQVVVPAAVVVSGPASEEQIQQASEPHDDEATGRRRRPGSFDFYVCPYNDPSCIGDCPLCTADHRQVRAS